MAVSLFHLEKQYNCTLQRSTLTCANEPSRTQLVLTDGAVVTQSKVKLRQKHYGTTRHQRGNSSSEAADGIKLLRAATSESCTASRVAPMSAVTN